MTDPVTTETTLAQAVGAAISARNVAVTAKNDAVDAKVETEALVEIARGLKNNASDAAASAATALSGVDAAIATALDGAVASVVASATAEINADIPAAIDAEVGPASAPYIAQAESARDDSVAAKTAAETARDNALAAERRIRQQSLGTFADDAAAVAWAAAQSPAITIITGTSYLNSTTDIFRYAVVTAGPTITWHDVTEDEAAQAALATASATAAQNALSDFLTRYVGPFNSTPTYVGDTAPWSIGALYWNRLQTKFFVWNGSGWDATDATAQAAASAAAGSAGTALAIAAGLSASGYTLDGIDAQRVGAIISAPKGLFMLDGAQVSLSSLLSFSSAAKYTVGPDGNYILNAANGPAWDWSTGRRRLLIEAIGATNYWRNSEVPDAFTVAATWAISNSANSLFGTLNRCTLTAGAANDSISAAMSVTNGEVSTITIALKNGTGSWARIGLYGTAVGDWGADADSTATVISGPGTLTRNGGALWNISGASADTVVRVSRVHRASETCYAIGYSTTSIGQTVSFGRPMLEKGYGSSYIVCGSTATARAADVVTAASGLLALLTGANATLAARGAILATSAGALDIIGSTSTYGAISVIDGTGRVALVDPAAAHVLTGGYPASFENKNFGVAATWIPSGERKVSAGTGVVSDNYQLFNGDTGFQLSGTVDGPSNILLDEIVVWPVLASDAGLQAQARVYL